MKQFKQYTIIKLGTCGLCHSLKISFGTVLDLLAMMWDEAKWMTWALCQQFLLMKRAQQKSRARKIEEVYKVPLWKPALPPLLHCGEQPLGLSCTPFLWTELSANPQKLPYVYSTFYVHPMFISAFYNHSWISCSFENSVRAETFACFVQYHVQASRLMIGI